GLNTCVVVLEIDELTAKTHIGGGERSQMPEQDRLMAILRYPSRSGRTHPGGLIGRRVPKRHLVAYPRCQVGRYPGPRFDTSRPGLDGVLEPPSPHQLHPSATDDQVAGPARDLRDLLAA